jgi:cytochrome c556
MKSIILLLVGLVVGALLATSAIGALTARDRYPKAVMVVMQANLSGLQRGLRTPDCGMPQALGRASQLAALTAEIPPAFATLERESTEFVRSRQLLEQAIGAVLGEPPADCDALNRAVTGIAQACDACHNGFR